MYYANDVSLPVNYHLIEKTETYIDKKTGKQKRRSPVSKNEVYRQLLTQVVRNQIPSAYVVNDVRFASAENMMFVVHDLKKQFVMPLKSNRKVALSVADKKNGQYVTVSELAIEPNTDITIYLEGVDFALKLVKQVFTNGDGSIGILYLVTSNLDLTYDGITLSTKNDGTWNRITNHSNRMRPCPNHQPRQ